MRRALGLTLLVLGLAPAALLAQDQAMSRAFELERRGNYAAAAEAYRGVLATKPGDAAALLGLERALLPILRERPSLVPGRSLLSLREDRAHEGR